MAEKDAVCGHTYCSKLENNSNQIRMRKIVLLSKGFQPQYAFSSSCSNFGCSLLAKAEQNLKYIHMLKKDTLSDSVCICNFKIQNFVSCTDHQYSPVSFAVCYSDSKNGTRCRCFAFFCGSEEGAQERLGLHGQAAAHVWMGGEAARRREEAEIVVL